MRECLILERGRKEGKEGAVLRCWILKIADHETKRRADELHTDRFPMATAARTAKTGLAIGLAYGLAQDAVGAMRGRRPGYVDFLFGSGRGKEGEVTT